MTNSFNKTGIQKKPLTHFDSRFFEKMFQCPHCEAMAQREWSILSKETKKELGGRALSDIRC